MTARPCRHRVVSHWDYDTVRQREIESPWCVQCKQMLSLGPSNDEPDEVRVELRAAELALFPADQTILEWAGERAFVEDHSMPTTFGGQAGWLAAAIWLHDVEKEEQP